MKKTARVVLYSPGSASGTVELSYDEHQVIRQDSWLVLRHMDEVGARVTDCFPASSVMRVEFTSREDDEEET